MRVGIGWDVQPYDGDTPLVLAGVSCTEPPCPDVRDGRDPVCRAIADALLGATGLGNLRDRLEAQEDREELGSLMLLSRCVRLLEEENYQVVNVDVLLMGKEVVEHAWGTAVRARLAQAVHTAPTQVSVRWSSAGGVTLPAVTDGEHLAALAVALVDQMQDIDVVHATMRSGG